jgi:MoaA/NifB/PqqE/SkfB family radical SAM enzyme
MCASSISRKGEKELSLSEIEKLAKVLDKLKAGIILLTGGEVFIRPDLPEIIRIFSRQGFTVRLQTNGILATDEKIKLAYQAGMEEITISLDSLFPEKQDALTGQEGSWHKIIEAILRFSKILPRRGALLGINTVVSRENLEEIPDIIKFVTEIGFYISLIPVHLTAADKEDFIIRRNAPEFAFSGEDFARIDKTYQEIIGMKRQGYNIYNSYKFLENSPSFLKGQRIKWHCDSPYLYFAISPSGKFLPCVDIKTSISMLDDDFPRLYKSREFQSQIREMVENCSGCFYACWPEMTFFCRDPKVLAERTLFALKAALKKRKFFSYQECLDVIERIRQGSL